MHSIATKARSLTDTWSWRILAVQWLLLLALLGAFRLAFLWRYGNLFADIPTLKVLGALLAGLRFDLSTVFALTGLPGLALLLVSPWRGRRWIVRLQALWVSVVAGGIVLVESIDLYYYAYVSRRLSFEVVSMAHDVRPIVAMIAHGYTLPAVLLLSLLAGLAVLLYRVSLRLAARPYRPVRWWAIGAQGVLLFLGIVLAVRGGLQTKPLTVSAAFDGPELALGHLTLNPVFTAAQAIRKGGHERVRFYADNEALRTTRTLLGEAEPPERPDYPLLRQEPAGDATGLQRAVARSSEAKPPNLVIIVLESFSAQMTGVLGGRTEVTPRFDRLASEGLLFSNFYASGTRSVEGIASVLTGYPALPNAPLLGSTLEQNSLWSLPMLLRARGYHTFFLHGAFRGSMWFDRFAFRNGFERYIAKEDFPDAEAHSDGAWGIFDHYALERLHEELSRSDKPVFGFFFSLSSHTPFTLPDESWRRFPEDHPQADLLNAFAYTDESLGRFFDRARRSDYWRNTVFMITADHNLGGTGLNARERMWIPLLILKPGDPDFPHGEQAATLGSQTDIAPTALDLLGISAQASFGGQSLLRKERHRFALFAWGTQAGWLTPDALLIHDLAKPLALYDWEADPGLTRNLLGKPADEAVQADAVRGFQAYYQTFNNLLLENRVAPPWGQSAATPSRMAQAGAGPAAAQ